MEELEPNYYAIIPAPIRYDKRLKDKTKLIYGEITALSKKYGYCFATNNYFAKLYGVSKSNISMYINELIKYGYITSEIIYKDNSKEIETRKLYLNSGIPILENKNTPILENKNTPILENKKDNNINNINNTSNNNKIIIKEKYNKRIEEQFNEFYNLYPKHLKKQEVYKWFVKNKPSDELYTTMLNQLERFKKSDAWKNKQFIPYPSTWLNQKRWEDEIDESQEEKRQREIQEWLDEEE